MTHKVHKAILLIFMALSGCSSSNLDAVLESSAMESEDLASPIKVLTQSEKEFVATMTTDKITLNNVVLDGDKYTQLKVPGFRNSAAKGAPEIPSLDVIIAVPRGKTLAFSILEKDLAEVRTLEHDLSFQYRLPVHNGRMEFAEKNQSAYQATYGDKAVVVIDESYAGAEKLATVRFFPVSYDPEYRRLTQIKFLKVHFYFQDRLGLVSEDEAPVSGGTRRFQNLVLNNETQSLSLDAYADTKLDLMIAHESLKGALIRYVQFKHQIGRQVKEIYVTGKTAEQIKEVIRQEYKSAQPPTTTMLVGSIDMIPSWPGDDDNTWTDYGYQALDSGSKPDVALGRVPAHDSTELNAFIAKAIARETVTRNYDDILITAGNDVSMGCPANVATVGNKVKVAGEKVNIIKKFRSEGASAADIIAGYNASPNLIVYDGHGYQQGMSEIPLLISDLGKLTNKSYPIILDIACLNANWEGGANKRNFAESILLKENGGAAGIMASGGSGDGHDFFQSIGELLAKGRKQMASGDYQLNKIGQVIMAAKALNGEQDKNYWNYYGDPASSAWEPDQNTVPVNPLNPVVIENIPVQPFSIFAGLSPVTGEPTGSSTNFMASIAAKTIGMAYCVGAQSTCRQATTGWLAMDKKQDSGAIEIHAARAPLNLTAGVHVTIMAKTADGQEKFREIVIQQK